MKLLELIKDLDFECVQGSTDIDITTLVYDSRKVENGSVFRSGAEKITKRWEKQKNLHGGNRAGRIEKY